ncbi:HlyD family efflux transporter periplasmic adaptor subunit [Stenotrophomonas maltophilia]|uniref:HlyD family efflux transporter periplasmic adaptor subunit n=2 Tax=Lysobacteraceae TaxID=32033 RepID=A0AA40Y7N4_STEMA|nr:HlyD family efflux transporter periplasmic adaptor subunit [Stenotrophomonas muris]AWB80035.1 anibiotic ABC transporter [Stenotrophomonas maltophilia]MBA0342886.1 HlyD family efflux transporter periplasmic adaptor subunit [Stenotrophomonas maltophilia]MBH1367327.1 HlyD family efflux transporter periplasmic adaptor subunit [Stenotrophomonas maltophilia]MBH1435489.1 HlyD family efflux transporter periplasmic adaptor subunit [Stenotrophomonas maltophilia]MBH1715516.1 HlyD family efflux transpo
MGLFLVLGQYTRRETVTGQLVPASGLINITALSPGTVARLHVEDGQSIQADEVLMEISSDQDTVRLGATRASIDEQLAEKEGRYRADLVSQDSVARHQREALVARESLIRRQLDQVGEQVALQAEEVEGSQALLERIEPLGKGGYISAFEIQRQQAVVRAARSRKAELQRQGLELQQQLAAAQESLAKLPLEDATRRNEIVRELADVAQSQAQNDLQRGTLFRARQGGVVAALLVKTGQMVSAGQPMITILPGDAKLQAQLLIPSRAIGFIAPGNRVILRYEAFPYQKFGQQYGRVSIVSRSALTPAEHSALTGRLPPADQGPLYRVDVELDRQYVSAYGIKESIRPGMALQADVLIERRRLIEWLFEPLFGIQRRVFEENSNG